MKKAITLMFLIGLSFDFSMAQETFIKRYKNSEIPETGGAVCELPNKNIAIIGKQANGLAWQAPVIVITDSAGNQLHHKMDTACTFCEPADAAVDSLGNIYVVGYFFGKAGVAKYDSTGKNIWRKIFAKDSLESNYASITLFRGGIVAVGEQCVDNNQSRFEALVTHIDFDGDTIWNLITDFENKSSFFKCGAQSVITDTSHVYVAGAWIDTLGRRVFFAQISENGLLENQVLLGQNTRNGNAIVLVSPDTLIVGGSGLIDNFTSYRYIYTITSDGDSLQLFEDTTFQDNWIDKLSYSDTLKMLYALDIDTMSFLGVKKYLNHISAFYYPISSLQQTTWEKTIKGTEASFLRGLNVAEDGGVLHTATYQNYLTCCPYLLKANENACVDIDLCDTTFVTGLELPTVVKALLTVYPNPFSGGSLNYQLESSTTISDMRVQGFALNGNQVATQLLPNNGNASGQINFDEAMPSGVYFLQFLINGQHKVHSRIVKIE